MDGVIIFTSSVIIMTAGVAQAANGAITQTKPQKRGTQEKASRRKRLTKDLLFVDRTIIGLNGVKLFDIRHLKLGKY